MSDLLAEWRRERAEDLVVDELAGILKARVGPEATNCAPSPFQ
jgi:hypothetical protein